MSCNKTDSLNRLAAAGSPYLREHADNPVDWYEWGEEALAKRKRKTNHLLSVLDTRRVIGVT
jgi:uncharacterized protein YyaL (SSP411 family)